MSEKLPTEAGEVIRDLCYLEQAEAHADEGPLGEPVARSLLRIALKYARIVAAPKAYDAVAINEAIFAGILTKMSVPWSTAEEGNEVCAYIASRVIDALPQTARLTEGAVERVALNDAALDRAMRAFYKHSFAACETGSLPEFDRLGETELLLFKAAMDSALRAALTDTIKEEE